MNEYIDIASSICWKMNGEEAWQNDKKKAPWMFYAQWGTIHYSAAGQAACEYLNIKKKKIPVVVKDSWSVILANPLHSFHCRDCHSCTTSIINFAQSKTLNLKKYSRDRPPPPTPSLSSLFPPVDPLPVNTSLRRFFPSRFDGNSLAKWLGPGPQGNARLALGVITTHVSLGVQRERKRALGYQSWQKANMSEVLSRDDKWR